MVFIGPRWEKVGPWNRCMMCSYHRATKVGLHMYLLTRR